LDFPERIYTDEEVRQARILIERGYKHQITIRGNPGFKQKVREALGLLKTAEFYDFVRTYIRSIEEIDGLTQLRQAAATIWANQYAVQNPVDGASVFVQKAAQMKEYIEGKTYYGAAAEKRSGQKRIEFLETLATKSDLKKITEECRKLIQIWKESSLVY
jgi:YHS domain-containing protein